MKTIRRLSVAAIVAALLVNVACAAKTAKQARTVSVNVHAILATVDDAERTLYQSGAVPAWTAEKHQQFSEHLVIALKAGKALNQSVRVVPLDGQARVDLSTVSAELSVLASLVEGVLPDGHPVRVALNKAALAALELIPIIIT